MEYPIGYVLVLRKRICLKIYKKLGLGTIMKKKLAAKSVRPRSTSLSLYFTLLREFQFSVILFIYFFSWHSVSQCLVAVLFLLQNIRVLLLVCR